MQWATAKRREGRWKDVRAYDADDLATWLEQIPGVHLWFSRVVGKCPAGVCDLSWYWEGWSGATHPPLSPELVIAGRQPAVDAIQQWLRGQPAAMGVQGETRDEAVAFVTAVLRLMPEQERERMLARSLVIEEAALWPQLATSSTPLMLIPTFTDRATVTQTVTLALMGACSDLCPLADAHTGQECAARIVRRLFDRARLAAVGLPVQAAAATGGGSPGDIPGCRGTGAHG